MAYLDVGTPSTDPGPDKGKRNRDKTPGARVNRYWKEIESYNKATMDWKEQGDKIVKLYLDQHRTHASPRRFALLWANVETLKPAIYAKVPNVLCSRRYKDPAPIGRVAAEILERATNTTFDLYNVDEVFRMVRDDRLLPGRGTAWVRYEAAFDQQGGNGYDDTESYDKVVGQKVCVDYVGWHDFGHNVAGTWNDVWVVWRIVHKTRDEVVERFGEKIAEKLSYSAKVNEEGTLEAGEHTARIYEVWDKRKKQTVWMSKECPDFLEPPDTPPLNFRNFFPCPEPCLGTRTGKSLIPTPDYKYYQDQANEIDDLTDKIANLTEWLQLRGFVPVGPSSEGGDAVRMMIQGIQSNMTNNKALLVPVESMIGFTERGGAGKIIEWLPIDIVQQALQGAVEVRNQLIQDVFQITGISDILRGQTDPNETLGAQEIKSQTGSRRVKNTKDALARFARDIGQLVAEVIAEQFEPQTIADMTGYTYTPGIGPVNDPAQASAPMPGPMPAMGGPPQLPAPGPTPSPAGPGMPNGGGGAPMPMTGSDMGLSAASPPPSPMPGMPAMMNGGGQPAPFPPVPQPGPPGGPMPLMPQPGPPGAPFPPTPPPPEAAPAAPLIFDDRVMQLLRDDRMRSFVIDIETDSTIQPDEDAEKQRRTEFITAVGGFLQQAAQIIPIAPSLAPMASEMLLFLTRGFRAGRSLEEVIERSMQQLQAQLMQAAQNPPPDPKAEAEKAKMEADGQRMQMQMQADQQKMQADLQFKQAEMQQKMQLEQQKMALEREKMEMEREAAVAEMQLKQEEAQQKMQLEAQKANLDAKLQQDKFDMDSAMQQQETAMKQATAQAEMQTAREKHDLEADHARHSFAEEQRMNNERFGQEQKHGAEAHTREMQRKDAMAMHESTTRANTEREQMQKNAGKPKRVRGKYGDKDVDMEMS